MAEERRVIGLREARAALKEIIEDAQNGKSTIISRHNIPVAMVTPLRGKRILMRKDRP